MSRCCRKETEYRPMVMPQPTFGGSNCICSLPTLVILILIVLQFSRCGRGFGHDDDGECCEDRCFPVGNGILFIVALFFLSCVGCGRGFGGGYGAY